MNVACWSCRAVFRVDPTLVPVDGTQARCARCAQLLVIPAPVDVPAVSMMDPWGEWGAPRDDWFADEEDRQPARSARRALVESEAEAAPEVPWEPTREGTQAHARAQAQAQPPIWAPASIPVAESDEHQRARRLARALVSDLVVYHPERREAALTAGTLRVAFREEIADAQAAYVAAVGREMAERTSYFVEALNEFLARGRALF